MRVQLRPRTINAALESLPLRLHVLGRLLVRWPQLTVFVTVAGWNANRTPFVRDGKPRVP